MKKTLKALTAIALSFATILTFVSCGIATKQIVIDFIDDPDKRGFLASSDTESIAEILEAELPDEEIGLIPVYNCGGLYANEDPVWLFAIDKENAAALGLEKMADDTMYFAEADADSVELEIRVTKEEDGGYLEYDIAYMTLNAESGVNGKLLKTVQKEFMTPSMHDYPIFFVNMETYTKIASAHLDKEITDICAEIDSSSLLDFKGVVIETNKAGRVEKILESHNYY